ncbi:MAG TPA: MFS transporter [Thermococcus paralvinellae]|uniref:MFS transporter n=1 Tax=Thermococcus paralvinellae TaxID=582419 RepID=A0A832ZEU7_9EURY|nr:MFS transporter [Thermococcus paralvinellae]
MFYSPSPCTYRDFVLYLNSYVTLPWIGLAYSLNRVSNLLLEYPSGVLADKVGRLKSTMLGSFLLGMGMPVLVIFEVPRGYIVILSAVLGGAGMAFISGSLEAWAVDTFGRANLKKLFSNMGTLKNIGGVVASVLAGISVKYMGLKWPLLLSGALGVLSPAMLFFLKDNRGHHDSRTILLKNLKMLRDIRFSMLVLIILLVSSMLSVFFMIWPITLRDVGIHESLLGFVYFVLMTFMAIGSYLARRASNEIKGVRMFLIGGTVITSTIALPLKSNPTKPTAMLILVLLFVFEILIGSYYVFIARLRNSVIPSEIRASASSMISLVNFGVGMVILPLFLALGDLASKWIVCSLLLVFGMIVFELWKTKYTQQAGSKP